MDEVSPDVTIVEVVLEQRRDLYRDYLNGKGGVGQLWTHLNGTDVNRTVNQIVTDFAFRVFVQHFSRNLGYFCGGIASNRLVM